jgi:tetratricopeptide (TPR) repeat protein
MMDSSVLRVLVALGVCAGFVCASHAHPVLSFVEQKVTQPAKDSKQKPRTDEFPVSVTLGHQYLTVDSQGTRQIFDFEHRRLYQVKLADRTFEDVSLFSVLGFNALELQNRLRIASVLNAAKVQSASQDPVLVEHLFSLSGAGQTAVIDNARSQGATVFSWKGKELLSISDETQPLPASYQAEYWRWLRYAIGGHPQIYAELQKRTGVPQVLRTTRTDIADQLITLRLTNIANAPDAPYSLAGFTRATSTREPYLTLQKIGRDGAAGLAARSEAAKRDRDAATAQGRILDAGLAHFAYALSAGDSSTDWLMQTREQLATDTEARAFAASLSAKNTEQALEAVKTLRALRAKTSSPYAYLLDVFAANHEVSLKHSTEAEKLFLSALSSNPYLTGAWFDLGKLYYGTFKTQDAWACWDAARSINPNHPFGKNIDTMERQMAADHPELF